ncbi:UNVERIFIED_CONTAM: Polygalacturonase QRT2 [Sesamum angustifolium]|uniref:Polygalacturonase QRT2 n=1 Tax=Sesamum angustifolium TaxID=2727405 RepID=A0AAW2MRD5_9LAMI
MDYGATSDDLTDDSHAFLEAWNDACGATVESSRVYVPAEKTFVVIPSLFMAHAMLLQSISNGDAKISGRIMAPESPSSWDGGDASQWLGFKNVNGLKVDGFGLIDGQGKAWWDQSCRYHPQLALKFVSCNESSVGNMKFTNSAQTHILVRGCNSFSIDSVVIESPGNSPNTDGIHIQSSQDVLITNSKIACGQYFSL